MTEQFVGQQIVANLGFRKPKLYYWERLEHGSSAEVDYLVQVRQQFIPIEVKSGAHGRLGSLHLLLSTNPEIPFGIKTSADNFSVTGRIISIPLYALGTWLQRAQRDGG